MNKIIPAGFLLKDGNNKLSLAANRHTCHIPATYLPPPDLIRCNPFQQVLQLLYMCSYPENYFKMMYYWDTTAVAYSYRKLFTCEFLNTIPNLHIVLMDSSKAVLVSMAHSRMISHAAFEISINHSSSVPYFTHPDAYAIRFWINNHILDVTIVVQLALPYAVPLTPYIPRSQSSPFPCLPFEKTIFAQLPVAGQS